MASNKKGIVINNDKKLVTLYTDIANSTEVALATGLVAQGFELVAKTYPKKSRSSKKNATHKESWYIERMDTKQAALFDAQKKASGFMAAVKWFKENVEVTEQ